MYGCWAMLANSICTGLRSNFAHRRTIVELRSMKWATAATTGKTVLVLGATGGIGGEVARQLRDAGWKVRALHRGGQLPTEQRDGIEWIRGDAMNRADVMSAASGCSVIVHAVNPPGYRRWSELVLP